MSKQVEDLTDAITSGLFQIPFHPLSYVKVLAQVGHEPLAPFKSLNMFGREQLFYPNCLQYCGYIYSVEGFSALYRGVGLKVMSHTLSTYVYSRSRRMMNEADETKDEDVKKEKEKGIHHLIKLTQKKMTARCWAVILSHPLHVMCLRSMAQFVGGETRYSSWNIFKNGLEIYRFEGIQGFFNGVMPRILFEVSTIALTSTITYMVSYYVIDSKEYDGVINLISSLFASSVTYPLSLVSTISSIGGSHLIAGQPPMAKNYKSWIEVFKHYYENNQFKRGSTGFFRVYIPRIDDTNTIDDFHQAGFKLNTNAIRADL